MALRAAVVGRYVAPSTDASRRGGARQAWLGCRQGFTSNITNPTVLPQFLPAGGSALQAVPLALVHAVVSAAYLALVTLGADRARRVLQRRRVRRAVDALTGTAMLGFGISLASEQV